MTSLTATRTTSATGKLSPASVATGSVTAFLVLYALLHVIKPELNPTWNTTSEYAIGNHGWIMVVAFLAQALGLAAVFAAVKSHVKTVSGRIGLGALLLGAAGVTVGGVFVADPITTPQDALSTSGAIHGMGAGLAMLLVPLAAAIVSVSLARKSPAFAASRKPLLVAAALSVAALIGFFAANAATASSDGTYGPDVLIGIPDRITQIANCAWAIVVVRCAAKRR